MKKNQWTGVQNKEKIREFVVHLTLCGSHLPHFSGVGCTLVKCNVYVNLLVSSAICIELCLVVIKCCNIVVRHHHYLEIRAL